MNPAAQAAAQAARRRTQRSLRERAHLEGPGDKEALAQVEKEMTQVDTPTTALKVGEKNGKPIQEEVAMNAQGKTVPLPKQEATPETPGNAPTQPTATAGADNPPANAGSGATQPAAKA